MPLDGLHGDRDRARSFGLVAEQYDRFRSGYPAALFDDLTAGSPLQALDVGCGTGKAATGLARRGVAVLGVEPDEQMATVARRHGAAVEVASFEDWVDRGRRFDLIVSGHAWHWVDPAVGVPKAAGLVRPGGTVARFWNYHALHAALLSEVESLYCDLAPGIAVLGRDVSDLPDAPDPFVGQPGFTHFRSRRYQWQRVMTARQWTGFIATFSDHMLLGPDRLAALQDALNRTIDDHGGTLTIRGGTYLQTAQKRV